MALVHRIPMGGLLILSVGFLRFKCRPRDEQGYHVITVKENVIILGIVECAYEVNYQEFEILIKTSFFRLWFF